METKWFNIVMLGSFLVGFVSHVVNLLFLRMVSSVEAD
jgi:hypothetical protein